MKLRLSALALVVIACLGACSKEAGGDKGKDKEAAALSPIIVSAEDVLTLGMSGFSSGPVVTGSIQAERRADLRAEVSAVVLQVLKDNGDKVRKGDLLVRLDDTAIRDSLNSAEESARASAQSLDQAERQFQRLKTLQSSGMSSMQAMEDAEVRRNNAQSDLVSAKARVATARQQLQRTEVRAPFDGVVSERKVSPGDSAMLGKELVKVLDPASLRFEGLVTAEKLSDLKIGQQVFFKVNGYPQTQFTGVLKRIDVSANASTRQVAVLVEFKDGKVPQAAGLYAEGQVESQQVQSLLLPPSSVQKAGDKAFVWQLKGQVLRQLEVKLGQKDARLGDYQVVAGLTSGDKVLRHTGSQFKDGQAIEFRQVRAPAASAQGN